MSDDPWDEVGTEFRKAAEETDRKVQAILDFFEVQKMEKQMLDYDPNKTVTMTFHIQKDEE